MLLPAKTEKKIRDDLLKEDSIINKELLPIFVNMLKSSSTKMSQLWPEMEDKDATYRAVRMPDTEDREQAKKDKPIKIIVPVAFAQIQTAAAFLYDQFVTKQYLFEFAGVGPEDQTGDLMLMEDLRYQANKAKMLGKHYYSILDGLKYGFGVSKVDWRTIKEDRRVMKEASSPLTQMMKTLGVMPKKVESVEEFTIYEGNNITNVSPYCFLPDPSVPLARFQEGDFCGHEEEVTAGTVKREEGKLYWGTEFIKVDQPLPEGWEKTRPRKSGASFMTVSTIGKETSKVHGMIVLTELQFVFNPKEWKDKLDIDFGTDKIEKWVAVIANDVRIISLQPLNYLHGRYTYALWESAPDHNFFYNGGFLDSINELQKQVSWLINSHMVSVSQVLKNRFIVNPSAIHVEDLELGKTAIRTKLGFTGEFDRAFKQLNVQDVTQSHWNDVNQVQRLMQTTSGVSENAMGSYSTGRRSATQTRDVNSGASLRLNTIGSFHYNGYHIPVGEMILANTRQNRSKEMYEMVAGDDALKYPFESVYMPDARKIVADLDFAPYSVTSPNERYQRIQSLTQLAELLVNNPQAAQMLGKDPNKVLNYLAELQGIRNLDDFNMDQMRPVDAQVGNPAQIQQALAGGGQPADLFGNYLK